MSTKEIFKRYILFVISLFFAAMGVAVTKRGDLGVSPVSSVANVMSSKFDFLSMGVCLIIWNCLLVVGQIIILRRDFKLFQLLQIPLSLLFGIFTDFGIMLVSFISVNSYAVRLLCVIGGIIILGFGISLLVIANVIMNSGEAFVKALSDKTGIIFGNLKIGFDIFCVLLSILLSMVFFGGQIVGTREGTVITALFTGMVVNLFVRLLKSSLNGILKA